MQTKLGIGFVNFPTALSDERQMILARAAGFCSTALTLGEERFDERFAAAERAGVRVDAVYMPRDGVNFIWQSDEKWERLHALYTACLSAAKASGVSTVIATVSSGDAPASTQEGLAHLRTFAAEAKEMGVHLAFENTESAEHFELAVRNCCLGFHGVCFRPSMAAVYWGSSAVPAYAKKHLFSVAIDDVLDGNDGYIPYDGEIDYAPFIRSLADASYRGVYFARVSPSCVRYRVLRYESFASGAYEGLCRLARLSKDEEGIL